MAYLDHINSSGSLSASRHTAAWKLSHPCRRCQSTKSPHATVQLTSIDVLRSRHRNIAQILDLRRLCRKLRAVTQIASAVHSDLERVILPTEDVVTVLPKSSPFKPLASSLRCHYRIAYVSPVESTNGWLPSSGQSSLLLNPVVFHITYVHVNISNTFPDTWEYVPHTSTGGSSRGD